MAATAIWITVGPTYVVPAIVVLESLRGNIPEGLALFVRDTGLTEADRALIERQATSLDLPVTFHQPNLEELSDAPLLLHMHDLSAWAKLLSYPETDHRFVLDLDVDTLVRQPLHSLIRHESASPIAAVPCHFTEDLWEQEIGDPADFGVFRCENFFMGGVCLINTDDWRQISAEALKLLHGEPGRWKSDLSVMNVACLHRWDPLPARWNVWTLATRGPVRFVRATGASTRAVARSRDVAIAHFPGHFKPWLSHYRWNVWKVEWELVRRRSVLGNVRRPAL